MFSIFHNLECEHCGADLTQPRSVAASLSDGERVYDSIRSHVVREDEDGRLVDPDGRIDCIGHHAGSRCAKCGKPLEELLKR